MIAIFRIACSTGAHPNWNQWKRVKCFPPRPSQSHITNPPSACIWENRAREEENAGAYVWLPPCIFYARALSGTVLIKAFVLLWLSLLDSRPGFSPTLIRPDCRLWFLFDNYIYTCLLCRIFSILERYISDRRLQAPAQQRHHPQTAHFVAPCIKW